MRTQNSLAKSLLVACDMAYAAGKPDGGKGKPLGVYQDSGKYEIAPKFVFDTAYTVKEVFSDPLSGFKAVLFERNVGAEYILAFAGTDHPDPQDWAANSLHLGWNQWAANRAKVLAAAESVLNGGATLHITGQSLGGGLAEYAAFDLLTEGGTIPAKSAFQSRTSVTTFNGLGGEEVLRQKYATYTDTVLANVRESATFVIRNDIVSRLGGGHAGIPTYQLNFHSNKYNVDGKVDSKWFDLNPIDAHRIESGFYGNLERGVEFNAAQLLSGSEAKSRMFDIGYTQRIVGLWGGIFGEKGITSEEAKHRIAAGLIAGAFMASPLEIDRFAKGLWKAFHNSGDMSDDAYAYYSKVPWGLVIPSAALILRDQLVPLYANHIASAIGASDDIGGLTKSSFSEFLNINYVAPAWDGSPSRRFQRGKTLIDQIDPTTPKAKKVFGGLTLNMEEFAEHLSEVGPDWMYGTAAYLHHQAIQAIDQQGLDPKARAEAIADYGANLLSWIEDERQAIANEGPEVAQELLQARDRFAIDDLGNALANLGDVLNPVQLAHANGFGNTRMDFANYDRHRDALADAITDPEFANIRDILTSALKTIERSGDWVAIRAAGQTNPFDTASFSGEDSVVATDLAEGGVRALVLYLPYEVASNQKVRLTLSGASVQQISVVRDGDPIQVASDGSFDLVVPAGQREVVFGLRASQDIDSDSTLSLSAQLTDSAGNPTHRSHTESTIAFDAMVESAPTTSNNATGTTLDDNRISTGGRRPVYGTAANDRARGLAGRDEVIGYVGDDILEGGDNIDIAIGGDGDDAVFGNVELTETALQDYIATSATATTPGTMPAQLQITQAEWLQGGLGDDKVVGASSNDIIFGGGGKDLLVGGAGHDVINGDDDYDPGDITTVTVEPGTGPAGYFDALYTSIIINGYSLTVGAADEIHAGSGDDWVFGEMGADSIWGDDGSDKVSGGHEADAIFGGRGNDRLTGDSYGQGVGSQATIPVADDYLDGGEGDDDISGDGGADTILGGLGNDTLRGNNNLIGAGNLSPTSADDGADYLSGGAGDDSIAGDAGQDTLLGGDGNDYLFGDSDQTPTVYQGNDDLEGGNGNDYLRGYGGNDTLAGSAGTDSLLGEAGDDQLDGGDVGAFTGGLDRDLLFGGTGNDILRNAYQMTGDEGDDELFNAWDMWGGDGNDRMSNGRTMIGGNGNDQMTASITGSRSYGDAGADTLLGASARDELAGGSDNDTISGEGGDDVAWGESGDDLINGGSGADQLQGGVGADQLQGDDGNDVLFGQEGNDTLSGGTGKDYLLGGAGNDTYRIDSLTDDDVIIDSEGVNVVEFGDGITLDQLSFRQAVDESGNNRYVAIVGGGGSGRVIVTGGMDGAVAQYKFADGMTLSATDVATRASAATTQPAQQLNFNNPLSSGAMSGTPGNDTLSLSGLSGNLYGYDGNDTLTGGKDASSINGGRGDDRIDGGGGSDQLNGHEGKDTYVFGRASGNIAITDQHFLGPLPAETDTIELMPGIVPADVRLVRDGINLVVMLDNGPVQARVEGHFLGKIFGFNWDTGKYEFMPADTSIEQIRFADGTVWNAAQIAARVETGTVNTMTGTAVDNTFVVDNGDDIVSEAPNGGNDTIQSSVSYALRPNVERLVLTGKLNASAWANEFNPVSYLVGNDGNNTFNGAGAVYDANGGTFATGPGGTRAYAEMAGGKGDDTYYLDYTKGGLVVENANEGIDTVFGTFGGPYTLPANVENYKDLGSGSGRNGQYLDELIGNALDNRIEVVYGGPNLRYYIDGGAGADTMIGSGAGDVYIVDNVSDRVVETSTQVASLPQMQDEIRTSISYELVDNVENLLLTGTAGIEAWGNTLANRIDAASNTAANTVHGGLGNDYYVVDAGDTIIESSGEGIDTVEFHGTGTRLYSTADLPANVENITLGSDLGASDLEGDAGNNALIGNDSNNRFDGRGGDDFMYGGGGLDTFVFSKGFGHDTASNSGTGNVILFDDTITRDDIYFKGGRLHLANSDDSLSFGNADLHFADGTVMTWAELSPILTASQSPVPSALADLLNGTAGDDQINALGGDDYVYGLDGNDTLDGGADNDTVNGGAGADAVRGNDGNDKLSGGAGNDIMEGGPGFDTLDGDDGDDTLSGGDDNDTLRGGLGHDVLEGGLGQDNLYGGGGNDTLRSGDDAPSSSQNNLYGEDGNDYLTGSAGMDNLSGGAGDDTLDGLDGDDAMVGGDGNDSLLGGAGDDTLLGGDGGDILDGGAGTDVLRGESGIDTYVLATGNGIDTSDEYLYSGETAVVAVNAALAPADISVGYLQDVDGTYVLISANGGADGLRFRYFASNPAVEVRFGDGTVWSAAEINDKLSLFEGTAGNDVLVGSIGPDRLFGYAGNDSLSGQDGNDFLDGGTGVDTMTGGTGDDAYVVDQSTDVIIEALNEGLDAVQSAVTYVLPVNVENLSLTSSGAFNLTGNAQDNLLTGNISGNTLDGKAGRDTMIGGAGNDTYVVDNIGDLVTELAAEGTDTVQSGVTFTLGTTMENLTLTGSSAISGTGNAANNVLTGNTGVNTLTGGAGNDQLNGGAGADTLKGGAGNDTYTVDNTSDVITEAVGEGTDDALASATYTLGANVETLTLTGTGAINGTGNASNNTLRGNSGNNILSGLAGADTLVGGVGNDTYVVDNTGDIVSENATEGTDLVQSSITLALAANVENLTLTGTAAINATGNSLVNTLTGNAGNNILDGGAGADTLKGGAGNDTYVIDVATDVVTEVTGEGTDLIQSAITLTLATNTENLTLTGSNAINGTGNTLDNVITGNTGDNVLNGGTGNDTLKGGFGNDTYVVDVPTDVVTENVGEGTDLVQSVATFTLAANIEYLTLTGTAAINGTGNTLDNWLRGNTGINTMSGMDGNDTLWGDAGNDILNGNNGNDLVQGGVGNDAVTDTVGNNLLDGGAGADTLVGGTARAIFIGGVGADTLTTGNGADIIGFNKGDGADIVNASSGTDDTLTLGGGLAYVDLKLRKTGLDLILDASNGDQVTFKDWYQTGVNNKSVLNLQVVADAMTAYNPLGTDPLLNRKVVDFNFQTVVTAFDAALVANPTLTSWNVSNALSASYLWGSDTSALGGDLAYDFGHRNSLATIGAAPAQSVLANAAFATSAQVLQTPAALYSGNVRLA